MRGRGVIGVAILVALTACSRSDRTPNESDALAGGGEGTPGVELVDIELGPGLEGTWFAMDPHDPQRAIISAHAEWNEHALVLVEEVEGRWRSRGALPFSGEFPDRAARFGRDGSLLFSSRRPGGEGDWDLWLVDPDSSDPEAPTPFPHPVNTEHRDYHGSMTDEGVLYFISTRPGSLGEGDILRATPGPNGFTVEPLPDGINTPLWEVDVLVSPDERYIVFARTDSPDGLGGDDLFLSFNTDAGWSAPVPLAAPLNSAGYEFGIAFGRDADSLTFSSSRSGRYAVYATAAEALGIRP